MGYRQKCWARQQRTRLLGILGNKCAACASTENLEFDVMDPVPEEHHGMDTSQRMSFYRRMWRFGNLQILCGQCNAAKGDMGQAEWMASINCVQNGSSKPIIIKVGEYCEQPRQGLSPRGNGEVTL